MLSALGDNPFVAHCCHLAGDLIGVDELGIAEDARALDTEELAYLRLLHAYLIPELYGIIERGDGVRIGLSDELHAPCGSEFLEAIDQCRLVVLHLLKSQPRDREAYTEVGVGLQ